MKTFVRKASPALIMAYILSVGLTTASATIINDNEPSWRGDANTTYQAWSFDNNNSPADLELDWVNPNGTPELSIDPLGGTTWVPSYHEEFGIWNLYGESTMMVMEIPNTGNTAPDSFKEVWIQVTYYDLLAFLDPGYVLPFIVDPVFTSVDLQQRTILESGYYHDTYSIIIEPNPTHEQIKIKPVACSLYVDEVVIDTICIPEPSSVVLLVGMSGMIVFVRRKFIV